VEDILRLSRSYFCEWTPPHPMKDSRFEYHPSSNDIVKSWNLVDRRRGSRKIAARISYSRTCEEVVEKAPLIDGDGEGRGRGGRGGRDKRLGRVLEIGAWWKWKQKYPTHTRSPAWTDFPFTLYNSGSIRARVVRVCARAWAWAWTSAWCVRACVRAYLYVGDVTKSSLAANAFAEGDPWKRGQEGGGASAVSMEREESMAKSRRWIPVVGEAKRWSAGGKEKKVTREVCCNHHTVESMNLRTDERDAAVAT